MAVKLRLRRMGRKKQPFYRIIAADSRSPRDGRFIEEIGYYNPLTDPMTIEVKEERALYWLGVGAIPSPTVKTLLRKKGLNMRFDLMKRGVEAEKIEEEMKKWEALQVEKLKRLDAKKVAEKQKVAEPEKVDEAEPKAAEKQKVAEPEKVDEAEPKVADEAKPKKVDEAEPEPVADQADETPAENKEASAE